jgi:tetratricopeptide (TPR) repeat protein
LRQATATFPDTPELLLVEAVAFGLNNQSEEAEKRLAEIESRWPEWSQPYVMHATILVEQAKYAEAKSMLQTAIALGTDDAAAYYDLAEVDLNAAPLDLDGATQAIHQALSFGAGDPYVHTMAGKIAFLRKDYPEALHQYQAALQIWPDMVEAHQHLGTLYRAMGEKEKALAEMREVVRIKRRPGITSEPPANLKESLIFSVRPPRR